MTTTPEIDVAKALESIEKAMTVGRRRIESDVPIDDPFEDSYIRTLLDLLDAVRMILEETSTLEAIETGLENAERSFHRQAFSRLADSIRVSYGRMIDQVRTAGESQAFHTAADAIHDLRRYSHVRVDWNSRQVGR